MNFRKTILLVLSIMLLAGLASANWAARTLATPQGDAAKPKPSASVPPKDKPAPKPDQPKKPPPPEGGW
jgi:hypothetical protein